MLDIVDGVNNGIDFPYGRHLGKELVVAEIRYLITVPVPVKDIKEKIPHLCDMDVIVRLFSFRISLR